MGTDPAHAARLALVRAETKGHDGAVLPRVLAAAASALSVVYLGAYLWVIDAQDGAVAWWYVVLMVLAALSFALAALDTWARAALTVGLVTSALAMLVALLSLGALLAPAIVAAAIALVVTRPGANAPPQKTNRNRVSNEGFSR
jgi:cytochrome bd-type quinol oxidase subunit 2